MNMSFERGIVAAKKWICVRTVFLLFLGVQFIITTEVQGQRPLRIGNIAPPLVTSRWIKGDSMYFFTKGQVYAVNFTGTWCPPCLKKLPQLSKIATKYGNVASVISVFIAENEQTKSDTNNFDYINGVENLTKRMGERLKFSIAVDNPQQESYNMWMRDTTLSYRGPSTIFVVDKIGHIFWIGHIDQLDTILTLAIKGKQDSLLTRRLAAEMEAFQDVSKRLLKMIRNRNYLEALSTVDSLLVLYPEDNSFLYRKFQVLAHMNPARAYEWTEHLLHLNPKGFDWTHFVSEFYPIAHDDRNFKLETRAIDWMIKNAETTTMVANGLCIKARRYFQMKAYSIAQKVMQQAKDSFIIVKGNESRIRDCDEEILLYKYKEQRAKSKKRAARFIRKLINQDNSAFSKSLISHEFDEADPNYDLILDMLNYVLPVEKNVYWQNMLLVLKADAFAGKGMHKEAVKYYILAVRGCRASSPESVDLISYVEKRLEASQQQLRIEN